MSNLSNALTVGSSSQNGAAGPGASAPRAPPDVITYSYASRMVYVAPAETHDGAIDIAKESFRELKDVDRDRISFEVHVKLSKEKMSSMRPPTAEIGRSVWPIVVPSLARFEIVEIRVAPVAAPTGKTAEALSGSQVSAVAEPPPYCYTPERNGYSDAQMNVAPYGSQSSSSSSPSLVTRIGNLLTPKSSSSRLFP